MYERETFTLCYVSCTQYTDTPNDETLDALLPPASTCTRTKPQHHHKSPNATEPKHIRRIRRCSLAHPHKPLLRPPLVGVRPRTERVGLRNALALDKLVLNSGAQTETAGDARRSRLVSDGQHAAIFAATLRAGARTKAKCVG